jgi:hypothetical protein
VIRFCSRTAVSLLITLAVLADVSTALRPGVRNAHAMVYDENRAAVVLFGGADATMVRSDTWAWDGTAWRRLELAGPSPRTFPAFAWDAVRDEAVLFGGRRVLFGSEGQGDACLSDTWILGFDGWHLRAQSGPPPRSEAGIAFDRHRGVAVLFGGYDDAGGKMTRLGDTWEWDGTTWRLRARAGPAPRSGVAMAYDERLRRVVLFGGNGGPRTDTWTWDGREWHRVSTAEAPGRFNAIAQYDAARQRIVRTTGWNGIDRVRETWLFDRTHWRLAASDGPSARNHAAMAFDRRRSRMVLFGGHDGTFVFGDTWEWDGAGWTNPQNATPLRRVENRH